MFIRPTLLPSDEEILRVLKYHRGQILNHEQIALSIVALRTVEYLIESVEGEVEIVLDYLRSRRLRDIPGVQQYRVRRRPHSPQAYRHRT
jgi:hypothetical protein